MSSQQWQDGEKQKKPVGPLGSQAGLAQPSFQYSTGTDSLPSGAEKQTPRLYG